MRKFQVKLGDCQSNIPLRHRPISYMAVHVVMSPSLKCRPFVISVLAVHFYHLIQNPACTTEVFVAQMISQYQEYLALLAEGLNPADTILASLTPSRY